MLCLPQSHSGFPCDASLQIVDPRMYGLLLGCTPVCLRKGLAILILFCQRASYPSSPIPCRSKIHPLSRADFPAALRQAAEPGIKSSWLPGSPTASRWARTLEFRPPPAAGFPAARKQPGGLEMRKIILSMLDDSSIPSYPPHEIPSETQLPIAAAILGTDLANATRRFACKTSYLPPADLCWTSGCLQFEGRVGENKTYVSGCSLFGYALGGRRHSAQDPRELLGTGPLAVGRSRRVSCSCRNTSRTRGPSRRRARASVPTPLSGKLIVVPPVVCLETQAHSFARSCAAVRAT